LRFVTLSLQKAQLSGKDLEDIDASLVHLRDHSAKHPQPIPVRATTQPEVPSEPQVLDDETPTPEASKPADKANGAEPKRDRVAMLGEILKRQDDAKRNAAKPGDAKASAPQSEGEPVAVPHLATQIEVLDCKVASRVRDEKRLAKCIEALEALNATGETLLPFAWLQAILQQDAVRAEALLDDARKFGVNEATLQGMQAEQDKAFSGIRFIRWSLGGLAVLFVIGGVVALVRNGGRGKPNLPAEASAG